MLSLFPNRTMKKEQEEQILKMKGELKRHMNLSVQVRHKETLLSSRRIPTFEKSQKQLEKEFTLRRKTNFTLGTMAGPGCLRKNERLINIQENYAKAYKTIIMLNKRMEGLNDKLQIILNKNFVNIGSRQPSEDPKTDTKSPFTGLMPSIGETLKE